MGVFKTTSTETRDFNYQSTYTRSELRSMFLFENFTVYSRNGWPKYVLIDMIIKLFWIYGCYTSIYQHHKSPYPPPQ